MNSTYPSFPSWDEAQPSGYPPPPPVAPPAPRPRVAPEQQTSTYAAATYQATYPAAPAAPRARPFSQPVAQPFVRPETYPAAPAAPQVQPFPQPETYGAAYPQPSVHPGAEAAYGSASIAVTMRFAPIAFLFGIVKPVLTIDGNRVRAVWKRRVVVPVNPGTHLVHAHVPYLIPTKVGKADLPIELAPGQAVSLEYKAPLIAFMRGALGAPPQRYPGVAAAVAINAVAVAALAAAGLFGLTSLRSQPGFALPAGNTPTPAESGFEAPAFPVKPTGPAVPKFPDSSTGAGGAGLRDDATTRRVTGATFGRDEKTSTASSAGWPFAFRIPSAWTCVPGKVDLPDSDAVVCFDKATEKSERAGVVLRECPSTCDSADRKQLDQDWFVDTAGLRRANADTKFRQTAQNRDGKYQLELGHYFTDPKTGVKYQVGVDARTPSAKKTNAQKVVNDILSQTTF